MKQSLPAIASHLFRAEPGLGAPAVVNIFIQRKAGIIQPTLIEEINHAIRPNGPGHSGNSVDYQAKVFFTAAHCLFGSPAFGDVLHSAKHADWLARFVTHNFITDMHKSYAAIRTHESDFHIKEPAALQRFV